jgi:hypothetical protein
MKKAIGMFATLAIALAITGFAFAHWSETLYINGTVHTGTLSAAWSIHDNWDTERVDKDYSHIEATIDGDNLVVTVANAYPCIDYYVRFDIKNTGTIPMHIDNVIIDNPNPITVSVENLGTLPVQVHPGDEATGVLHVHVEQEALENTTYTFTVTVIIDQWNWPPQPSPPQE